MTGKKKGKKKLRNEEMYGGEKGKGKGIKGAEMNERKTKELGSRQEGMKGFIRRKLLVSVSCPAISFFQLTGERRTRT